MVQFTYKYNVLKYIYKFLTNMSWFIRSVLEAYKYKNRAEKHGGSYR